MNRPNGFNKRLFKISLRKEWVAENDAFTVSVVACYKVMFQRTLKKRLTAGLHRDLRRYG